MIRFIGTRIAGAIGLNVASLDRAIRDSIAIAIRVGFTEMILVGIVTAYITIRMA